MNERDIHCPKCGQYYPPKAFEKEMKERGFTELARSCCYCRAKCRARNGAQAQRNRQAKDITVNNELNRLLAWPAP